MKIEEDELGEICLTRTRGVNVEGWRENFAVGENEFSVARRALSGNFQRFVNASW